MFITTNSSGGLRDTPCAEVESTNGFHAARRGQRRIGAAPLLLVDTSYIYMISLHSVFESDRPCIMCVNGLTQEDRVIQCERMLTDCPAGELS